MQYSYENFLHNELLINVNIQMGIFAHQGFCVYEALAHLGMITCILTARRPVCNETFHCCND